MHDDDSTAAKAAQVAEALYMNALQSDDPTDAALARLADALATVVGSKSVDTASLSKAAKALGPWRERRPGMRRPPLSGEFTDRMRDLVDIAQRHLERWPTDHEGNARSLLGACVLTLGILHRPIAELPDAVEEVATQLRKEYERVDSLEPDVVARWVLIAAGVPEPHAKGWTKNAFPV